VASALARLYSSTFYALRDTRTPLRFAVVRVILTGVLGYLFAFPLPRALDLPVWVGVAGLTASAGIAGWVEFWLMRRSITGRIGATGMTRRRLFTLWGAGILAGLAGLAITRLWSGGRSVVGSALAIAAFSLVYGVVTLALGVPEARALVARVRRR
jgi:putative peptidoglycan lipid II flippase